MPCFSEFDTQLLGKINSSSPCKWELLAILCLWRKIQVRSLSEELWHVINCTLKAQSGKSCVDGLAWSAANFVRVCRSSGTSHLPDVSHSFQGPTTCQASTCITSFNFMGIQSFSSYRQMISDFSFPLVLFLGRTLSFLNDGKRNESEQDRALREICGRAGNRT